MKENKEELLEKEKGELVKHEEVVQMKCPLIGHEACGLDESRVLKNKED